MIRTLTTHACVASSQCFLQFSSLLKSATAVFTQKKFLKDLFILKFVIDTKNFLMKNSRGLKAIESKYILMFTRKVCIVFNDNAIGKMRKDLKVLVLFKLTIYFLLNRMKNLQAN